MASMAQFYVGYRVFRLCVLVGQDYWWRCFRCNSAH